MTKDRFEIGDMVYHVAEPKKHGRVIYIHADGYVRVDWSVTGTMGEITKSPPINLRIVSDFKIGDIVQYPGNSFHRKINFISQFGGLRFDDVAGEHNPEGFVKVKEPEKQLRWTDVEPGDKVTFTWQGEEFTATARKDPDLLLPQIMGMATTAMHKYTIVSIEKPKPTLPKANGTIIRRRYDGREAHLIGCTWLWADSGVATSPYVWLTGWEVVRSMIVEGKSDVQHL